MQPRDRSDVGTIREALLWASSFLREAGMKDPQFEAELLLRHCLGMSRTRFLASLQEPIASEEVAQLAKLCQRRAAHEPIQYMFGVQEFYGREYEVAPGVLIPRPETEILIEQVLRFADRLWSADSKLKVADIGTGSGAIALTLASERKHWQVTTVDLSPEALTIAKRNAERLGIAERVRFLQGDLMQPLLANGERLDILVSNPPYIPSADVEELDAEVRDYEPRLALDGGEDGLDCYRKLCQALPGVLQPQALVGFEVGIHQSQAVAELLKASNVIHGVEIIRDLAGIERVVIGWRGQLS
jgi:release factor glutamine methyltransferase